MLNNVSIEGRVTKDIELRHTDNGKPVVTTTIACQRPGKDSGADFISIVIWGKQAENFAKYVRKGQLVSVSGRLSSRSYVGQDGTNRYVTEVVANNYRGVNYIGGTRAGKQSAPTNNQETQQQPQYYGEQSNYEQPYSSNEYPSYEKDEGTKFNGNTFDYQNEMYSMGGSDMKMPW